MSQFLRGSGVVCYFLLVGGTAHAQRPTLSNTLQKWQESAGRLRSGSYVMRVHMTGGGQPDSKLVVSSTFDRLMKAERCTVQGYRGVDGQWLETPSVLAQALHGSGALVLSKVGATPLHWAKRWDPEYIGLSLIGDVMKGFSRVTVEPTLSKLAKESNAKLSVIQDRYYVYDVSIDVKGVERIRVALKFDAKKGYGLDKFEYRLKPTGREEWSLASTSTIEYAEQAGVWLPTSASMTGQAGETAKIDIDWTDVNKNYAEADFGLASLDLPDDTVVMDARVSAEKPLIIGKFRAIKSGDKASESLQPPGRPSSPKARLRRYLPISAGVVVLLLVGGWAVRSWRRQRTGKISS